MSRVFVAGSINMDVVATADRHPRVGETVAGKTVLYFPGGKGANQAVAAAKLGVPTTLIGRIGKDAFGSALKAFLAAHTLTAVRVEAYLRYRLEILRFIEQRFRQGIQISPQQIDSYYHDVLLPQYAPGDTIPPLDQVAPRIQEILLQGQVNVLFGSWLDNLRQQGDVEVLDPAIAPPAAANETQQNSGRGDQ